MVNLAIDYSFQHDDPTAIANAVNGKGEKVTAVLRYVPTGYAGKDVTLSEISGLHAAGLGIGFIWETTADRAISGSPAGQQDGNICASELDKLGVPPGTVIFVNIGDFAATADNLNALDGYYFQFRNALGKYINGCGGYGTSYIIAHMVAGGQTGIWWQNAMDDQGIAGSVVNTNTSIYQRVTPTISLTGDFDENAWGFGPVSEIPFWYPSANPAPGPVPVPVPASTVTEKIMTELPLVKRGDNSHFVGLIQGAANVHGYHIAIDNDFGPLTQIVVREIQQTAFPGNQAEWDGVVGPHTWPVLLFVAG